MLIIALFILGIVVSLVLDDKGHNKGSFIVRTVTFVSCIIIYFVALFCFQSVENKSYKLNFSSSVSKWCGEEIWVFDEDGNDLKFDSLSGAIKDYNSNIDSSIVEIAFHNHSKVEKILFFSFDYKNIKIIFNNIEDYKEHR